MCTNLIIGATYTTRRKGETVMQNQSNQTEKCVLCGRDTKVPVRMHISKRRNYIEGAGQCCEECYTQLETVDVAISDVYKSNHGVQI